MCPCLSLSFCLSLLSPLLIHPHPTDTQGGAGPKWWAGLRGKEEAEE